MATLTDIHDLIDAQLRLPVCAPKIYVLGDTGAGKSTVLQHILGTKRQAFPSALKRRTTVAITEYVIDKTVPYAACFLLKSAGEVLTSIEEILEYSQASIIKLIRKGKEIDLKDVIDNLGESPDQRFRLKYIVSEDMLEIFSTKLIESSISAIDNYEIGCEQSFIKELAKNIFDVVQNNLRKFTDLTLTEKQITHLVKYDDRDSCIDSAKLFLKAGKNSLSPLVSYARIQGGFGADWLPENSSFVIIDGEGIGHDIKETAILSARHLDYFKICDAIVVAEGAGKPFAAGGKSAIQGVIQNGYVDNLYLMMTKLDELIDEDAEEKTDFEDRIHDVKHEFKNLEQALKSSGIEEDRWLDNVSYIEGLKAIETPDQSIVQLNKLVRVIVKRHAQVRDAEKIPAYDVEMLSAYLEKVSLNFHQEWEQLFRETAWQSIKAFNRRMAWKEDEYRSLKPVAQLQNIIITELRPFISNPVSWPIELTPLEQQESIDMILRRFSSNVLDVVRERILSLVEYRWNEGMVLEGAGSTTKRKNVISKVWAESVPHYQDEQAVKFKDQIKQALLTAMKGYGES